MPRRALAVLLSAALPTSGAAASFRSGAAPASARPAAAPPGLGAPALGSPLDPLALPPFSVAPDAVPAASPDMQAARFNPGVSEGAVSAEEADAVVGYHVLSGNARRVWGAGAAAQDGDRPVADAERTEARETARAVEAAKQLFNRIGAGMGDGSLAFWAKDALDKSDIVVIPGSALLVHRDESNHQASHVGLRRRTIYVGEGLWGRLLGDKEALAGFLVHEAHLIEGAARRGAPRTPSQAAAEHSEALRRERLVDPEERLRGHVASFAAPEAPVDVLGAGPLENTLPLLARETVRGREDGLFAAFLRQWQGVEPALSEAFADRESELAGEKHRLQREAGSLRRESARLESFAGDRISIGSSMLVSQNDIAATARERRIREIDSELLRMTGKRARLERLRAQLEREAGPAPEEEGGFRVPNSGGYGVLSADEYAELLGDLLGSAAAAAGSRLRKLFLDEARFSLEVVEALLGEGAPERMLLARREPVSGPAARLLDEVRRAAEPGLLVQAHGGTEFYQHPELLVLGLRVGGLLSFSRGVLEYWVSERGRRDLERASYRPAGLDEEGYLKLLAGALASRSDDPAADLDLRSALIRTGSAELERLHLARHPSLEEAYASGRATNRLRWLFFGTLFLGALALDVSSALAGNVGILARHLVGYLSLLLFTERAAWAADWRHSMYARVELKDGGEPRLPPGLRTVMETLALRAGFRLGRILLSKHPEPRALAVKSSPEFEALSDKPVVDLIVTESLLERTFANRRTGVLEGALGHAIAHLKHHTRLFLGVASVGVWHLVDHLLPLQGAWEWFAWVLLTVPSYLLSWWLFRPQERLADVSGARLSGEPAQMAAFLREVHEAIERGDIPAPAFGLLPREPDLEERADRLDSLAADRYKL